jgi:carbamoyltransferase
LRAPQRLANRRAFAGAPAEVAMALGLNPDRVRTFAVGHHEAHLASAAATAPWEIGAAVSVDGFGDFLSTLSARVADGAPVETGGEEFPHSLGVLYQAVTQHLGFRPARAPRDRRRHAGPRSGSRR